MRYEPHNEFLVHTQTPDGLKKQMPDGIIKQTPDGLKKQMPDGLKKQMPIDDKANAGWPKHELIAR